MSGQQRHTEIHGVREKRHKKNKIERRHGHKEEVVVPASLPQHPIFLPLSHLHFLLFAFPLIFSFCYSSPLFLSLSLVFISLSLSFSVVQSLRQMSHEIFAIKTQKSFCV
ncbi:hypothetical protein ILYODFUR_007002 [Ilyodon furcidens]|uniref:Uncharacterized protein n=1 Tax=Ilyodon furcidens TaxID=33524 RepID=A0ABV0V4L4_9TELE